MDEAEQHRRRSIERLLHWTFAIEHAQLDLPVREGIDDGAGFGMEWVLMRRAQLGNVRIDGLGYRMDKTHEDAEVIAGIVGTLPKAMGGARMAVHIAELARAGQRPDWCENEIPRLVPKEWTAANQHRGPMGKSARTPSGNGGASFYVVTKTVPHPRYPRRTMQRQHRVESLYVPCRWTIEVDEIKAKRLAYRQWVSTLAYIRDQVRAAGLRWWELTDDLPPRTPWRKSPTAT